MKICLYVVMTEIVGSRLSNILVMSGRLLMCNGSAPMIQIGVPRYEVRF